MFICPFAEPGGRAAGGRACCAAAAFAPAMSCCCCRMAACCCCRCCSCRSRRCCCASCMRRSRWNLASTSSNGVGGCPFGLATVLCDSCTVISRGSWSFTDGQFVEGTQLTALLGFVVTSARQPPHRIVERLVPDGLLRRALVPLLLGRASFTLRQPRWGWGLHRLTWCAVGGGRSSRSPSRLARPRRGCSASWRFGIALVLARSPRLVPVVVAVVRRPPV